MPLDGPLILGAGLAGLSAALAAADAGAKPVVISPTVLAEGCASALAQGGMAAALGPNDTAEDHALDTINAGAGLVDDQAARLLTGLGPQTVLELCAAGAPFDRHSDGSFVLNREAAHGAARVARVGGDGAGAAILAAVIAKVRATPAITVIEHASAVGLITDTGGAVRGALIRSDSGVQAVYAPAVILATGGVGGLYAVSTDPKEVRGDGLALAALAGAEILDPEFVQFHPTGIDVGLDPTPLATEALRGHGATLIDKDGVRFVLEVDRDGELAARDIVARAVHRARQSGRGAYLDCTQAVGEAFPHEFPAVFKACMDAGVDPRRQPIPVAPAAHYHMGGIAADADGRTSVLGLYAVGECAGTGVHGANRLASNSLLEAAAFGSRAGRSAAAETPRTAPLAPLPAPLPELAPEALAALRAIMTDALGVERTEAGLRRAKAFIDALPFSGAQVAARFVVAGALARRESRGGHFRSDYPASDALARHTRLRFDDLDAFAPAVAAE